MFVERLWKSVKYERVYLYAYDSVAEARTSITQYNGLVQPIQTAFEPGQENT